MAGRFETAIEWAERAMHRRPSWYFAHFLLAASHIALGHDEDATSAVNDALDALPGICVEDLNRVPLKDPEKMGTLRERLLNAGFPK